MDGGPKNLLSRWGRDRSRRWPGPAGCQVPCGPPRGCGQRETQRPAGRLASGGRSGRLAWWAGALLEI